MRWLSPAKPEPRPWDLRIVRRFAWWPKQYRESKLWLEHYESVQLYRHVVNAGLEWVEVAYALTYPRAYGMALLLRDQYREDLDLPERISMNIHTDAR